MDRKVENIKIYSGEIDKESVYLVLINADHKPPHLGVVIKGVYKSLSVRGKSTEKFDFWVKKIRRKKLFTLLIKLNIDSDLFLDHFDFELSKLVEVKEGSISCLLPIKLALSKTLNSLEYKECGFVYEVYSVLKKNKLVDMGVSINKKIPYFELTTYGQDEIDKCIVLNKPKK